MKLKGKKKNTMNLLFYRELEVYRCTKKNGYKTLPWNPNDGEDIDMTKKAILAIIGFVK